MGWIFGGGFEGALWDNWSAKIEYMYGELGTRRDTFAGTGPFAPITVNSRIVEHVLRGGLNTRFDWFTPR